MEKTLMRAMAGELRGGQSHTVEIVVFIVFAALVGGFIISLNGGLGKIEATITTALLKVREMLGF